jgi:hypothetical protein
VTRGSYRPLGRLIALLCIAAFCSGSAAHAQSEPSDADLTPYAVHVNRTPRQSWPGYGVYLGNGLILTAAHVPGEVAQTKPRIEIGGLDLPATLVKQGWFETNDLTLMSVDATELPLRIRMRRMALCPKPSFPGEAVVVATPEGPARSHIVPARVAPPNVRGRFSTLIGDVATTGNSGSGVFDARNQCLLGIISRKITVWKPTPPGAPRQTMDVAKYFVPAAEIRAFLPDGVTF